jgi:two-component system NtrC family response regulator
MAEPVEAPPARVLVIEDDPAMRRLVQAALADAGYDVDTAGSGEEALAQLERGQPALVLTDLRMGGMSGLQVLAELRRTSPELPVVVMTSFGSVESAVEALRLGATDYLIKPLAREDIVLRVQRALRLRSLEAENRWLRRELSAAYRPGRIVAVSASMRNVVQMIERLAGSDASVLLQGETGTGKDLLARALHFGGPRADGPFVALNCAALPAGLVESELFGHARGSFTGALRERAGKLESAHRGTLFLDEVGELPLETQPKLLRALEDRSFERVGEDRLRRVDVRVIAASNRDLAEMVRQGKLREDLYFRLAVVRVTVPPLRERVEDIGPLARYLMARLGGEDAPELTDEAVAMLEARTWPGNVRELANVLEATLALHEGGPVGPAELRLESSLGAPSAAPAPIVASASEPAAPAPPPVRSMLPPEGAPLDSLVRDILVEALNRKGWNQSAAARLLRIPRHVLQYRMAKYRIVPPSARAEGEPGS